MDINKKITELVENKKDRSYYLNCIDEGVSPDVIFSFINKYSKNKLLFKRLEIRPHYFQEAADNFKTSFDLLDYTVNRELEKSKANKKMRSFFSSKTRHLVNEETERHFLELIKMNIDDEFYRYFRKKIAAFKNSNDLNKALNREIVTIKNWNYSYQESRLTSHPIELISTSDAEIAFEVFDFDTAKSLGTSMWCICRDPEDFAKYRSKTDRIIFKYDLSAPVSSNHYMTAYVTNASGVLKNGYLKDDSIMTNIEEKQYMPLITAMNYELYEERLYNSNINPEKHALKIYMDNMEHKARENGFDFKVSCESLNEFLMEKGSSKIIKTLLENYKEFLEPEDCSKGLSVMLHRINRLHGETNNEIFQSIINNKDYNQSKYFNDLKLMDVIEKYTLFINEDSVGLLIDKKNIDLTKELADYLEENKRMTDNKLLEPFYTKAGVDLFKHFKEQGKDELLRELIYTNFQLTDNLFGGNENPENILELFKGKEQDYNTLFLENLKNYALRKNIEPLSGEASIDVLKKESLARPKQIFIKEKKLLEKGVVFNYDESLSLLKKAFLDDDMTFSHYDKDYAMEDFLSAKINDKTKNIYFNSKLINQKARIDFFDFLDKCKQEVSIDLQKEYDEIRPKTNISKNKIKRK